MTDKWEMPEWMEKYRPYINNTGGNSIERLMNMTGKDTQGNIILAGICVAVHSQITLLKRLKQEGLLEED